MTMAIREILFPTDFSEVAQQAGQTAADIARHFGARLHVLHVVGPASDPARRQARCATLSKPLASAYIRSKRRPPDPQPARSSPTPHLTALI